MRSFKQFINESNIEKSRWNDYLKKNKMLKTGIDVLSKLNKGKYKAYVVGGAVRDIILGDNPHDIDISTNMPIEEIEKIFKTHDVGKSREFGIVTIKHKGEEFEISQFRSDGSYTDGRRPDSVNIVLDFETDAGRRDLTINAMGIDKDGNIIDYFNGSNDIKNKVIRTVGNPQDRFEEDKLRMMRAIRFSSKLGFALDDDTLKAIKDKSSKITQVSYERIRDELLKTAGYGGKEFANMIELLDETGILKVILPEISSYKDFEHKPGTHPEGNLAQHTLNALKKSKSKDPITNLSILLHDVGKTVSQTMTPDGPQYLQHAKKGVDLVNTIALRLNLRKKDKERIAFATLNHMKFHDILKMKNSKILKLMDSEHFQTLMDVAKADAESRDHLWNPGEWQDIMNKIDSVKQSIPSSEYTELKKLLNGKKIMDMLNIKSGPRVGEIIKQTLDWAIDNNVKDVDEIFDYIGKTFK
jgi:tRNA nucleotidyltransferase/poly(A) polymerase